jgi:phosphatidylglycerophosphate synthase
MRARLLLPAESGPSDRDLLGLPLALRAAFAAIDAGCTEIELAQGGAAPPAWTADARLSRPVVAPRAVEEERLLLRADAVVAPALLRELPRGHAACDAAGVRVAARVSLAPDADPAAALAAAPVHAFTEGRYCYAIAVTSPAARRAATRALLASLVKTSDGPVSVHVNRPISLALTRVLVPLGVSANQMTFVTALVAFAGAWFAAQAGWHAQALGAVLFQASSVLDGCDGEIARVTRRASSYGALLDSLVDDVSNLLFFSALCWGVAQAPPHGGGGWPVLAGVATAVGYLGVIATQYAVVLRATGRGDKTVFWAGEGTSGPRSPLMAFLHGLLRRNVFVAVIMLVVLADRASWVVAVLPFAALGTLAASLRKASARVPAA